MLRICCFYATIRVMTATALMCTLALPAPVLAKYQEEAKDYGVTIEELLASRLTECVDHNATKPLYFDDKQRRELEALLGRNVEKAASVIDVLKRSLTVKLNGIGVTLSPDTVRRLQTRCPRHINFGEWLQGQVTIWAEQFVGLR
jgi:hypothetical protein